MCAQVPTYINNILIGKRCLDHRGSFHVTCLTSGDCFRCKIKEPIFGKAHHDVRSCLLLSVVVHFSHAVRSAMQLLCSPHLARCLFLAFLPILLCCSLPELPRVADFVVF